MIIGTLKESARREKRVAMTPQSAQALQRLGFSCIIQSGSGIGSRFHDVDYQKVGVKIVESETELWLESDVILKVDPPSLTETNRLRSGQTIISFVYPQKNKALLNAAKECNAILIAMDMVPRISRAQKMDALSSMANIDGYRSIIEASNHFDRFLKGQITAAGKIAPAKILVIGAGVAGLSAIGTAQSLGAIVRAFDVRKEVSEQIESMGAEFLSLDFEEDGSGEGGYATPSSPEFHEKQLTLFRSQAPDIDIVITTALIPNQEAPKLWLKDMVASMKSGSIIIDLAAQQGGNCDLTVKNKQIETKNGVTIVGFTDFTSRMARQSSTLYSNNVLHMIEELTPKKNGMIVHNMENEIIRAVTVTYKKCITFPPPPILAIKKPEPKEVKKSPLKTKIQNELKHKKEEQPSTLHLKAIIKETSILIVGALFIFLLGFYAPANFMQHLVVFVLACFVGFQVIWNVSHALHTPLMSITNAISGIILLGSLLQIGNENWIVVMLSSISIFIAMINVVGGFAVTRRMLAMFQKS
ncbi:Re/Si-specific NAD(P)(+) transhydrogenase subunit alpha [Candidatus Endowatersipora endosymbiont of Watersipora subatra]|uniref:Re/Si-specific NAD(P)(+) transhydrogenase subunit alpha n=1 Tax=Candidatus Endowatersipora endosymbiont of Watersipora subatra TaxID=3077946 RepID=UPI00312C9BA1